MKILETRRLIFRHQTLSDLDDLFALYCDSDIVKYIPDAPWNYDDTRAELEWFMNGHPNRPELGLWSDIQKETGNFIGRCGLLPRSIDGQDEVEVAYLISKPYWGQGLGTEAAQAMLDYGFEQLNLPRLVCLVEKDNLASIKVAQKIGMTFKKEGRDELGSFMLYSRNNPTS